MAAYGVRRLYYITHTSNVHSILRAGILSHAEAEKQQIGATRIHDKQIVTSRRGRTTPDGTPLWRFANLYFQARNPMLYRVTCEHPDAIAVIAVRPDVLELPGVCISDGNAASPRSAIWPRGDAIEHLPRILRDTVERKWWSQIDSSKRRIMAECLVPTLVAPEHIQTIYVPSAEVKEQLESVDGLGQGPVRVPVVPEPEMFFQPALTQELTPHLSLIEGDMFFSRLQTLTISVNCVGVMGKGLASRAKYQFPDVYVYYQDLCRARKLTMGRPHLYKREEPFDLPLTDERSGLFGTRETWFLLFPTKNHWRERSDLAGIEKGLAWVCDRCEAEGMESLAVPALGCGLGRLTWEDVGPLMCRYLSRLRIPVRVYLPAERAVAPEHLAPEFLLPES